MRCARLALLAGKGGCVGLGGGFWHSGQLHGAVSALWMVVVSKMIGGPSSHSTGCKGGGLSIRHRRWSRGNRRWRLPDHYLLSEAMVVSVWFSAYKQFLYGLVDHNAHMFCRKRGRHFFGWILKHVCHDHFVHNSSMSLWW